MSHIIEKRRRGLFSCFVYFFYLKGHEKLMIYDPDRALYRQFGVSVSSVGLPLGQRRKTVFTRVDLREASSLADSAGLLTTGSIPDQSPDTDEERERGHNSDDGPLSLSEKLSFSSPSESEGSSSISEEEEDNGGSDEQQMGSVNLTAEDVYLSVGQSLNKLSGEEEIDDDDTDKDTELDDLLNYEISLSCLDIDVDAVDSLSVCSEEIDIYGGCGEENHWRDRMSVGGIGSEAPRISTLLSSRGGPVCEVAKIPQPRKKLRHSKNKLKASLKGTPTDMLIENYRPFSFAVPLKKPLKRLNFIAGRSSHNSNQRNAAPSLDYFCDDDRELSPPRARRTFSQDEPLAGRSPVVRNAADSSSVREIGRTRHLPAVSHSSELELMYNHQSGVREHYELNPLVYPPGTDHDMNILNAGCVQYNVYSTTVNDHGFPVSMHRPFEFVDRDIQATGRLGTWHPDSKDDRTLVPHNLPTSTPALGSPQERGADCSLYGHDRRVEKSNSIIFSDDLSHNLKSKPVDESTLDYSLRSVDSVVKRPRSTCSTGSDSSSASIFSSFSAFSMHSVKSAAKYIFSSTTKREEDKYSDSNSKSKLVAAQLERERAKERQRDIERGFEHSVGGGDTCNIPSQVTGSETLSGSGRGNPSELPASVPLLRVAEIDDSVPRRVWNTFPAISTNSSRKGRFISAEEELVDNEIESEINNFIVPDELSPIILRQYGIEMGMREVNGIRQNALISLPALLSEIAINAETYTEDEDDYMDEISQNELGLWERGTGRAEPFEDIERLISSSGSANSLHLSPMSGVGMDSGVTLRSSSYSNGDDALRSGIANSCFAMSLSAVAIPVMELHSTLLSESNRDSVIEITTSEEKFIGTSEQNNATQRASLLTVNGRSSNDSVSPLTVREAEDLILYKEAHLAWSALSAGSLLVSKELATQLLLKFAEDPESVVEPLETLVLLLDKLGANVNATNENNMTPLHSLFSKPALGRFILSRGGDVLAKDDHGDSVLSMCAEYGYHWMLPAFINMHGREAKLLEDPHRAHEYAVILISLWGFGRRVRELVEDGIVCISAEEALDIMDTCRDRFEDMREPVETFELLESIVLKG